MTRDTEKNAENCAAAGTRLDITALFLSRSLGFRSGRDSWEAEQMA